MRAHLLLAATAFTLLAGCRTSRLGSCHADTDCATGARCDITQDLAVCVVPRAPCCPACPSGQVCGDAAGVEATCTPACTSAQVCNVATGACDPATTAAVAVTSPASGAVGDGTLQATAAASGPGGVASLRFELRQAGTLVASAAGTAASSNPSHFAASLPLSAVADGASELRAIATYGLETATSDPVSVTVDQHAPTITGV